MIFSRVINYTTAVVTQKAATDGLNSKTPSRVIISESQSAVIGLQISQMFTGRLLPEAKRASESNDLAGAKKPMGLTTYTSQ